MYRSFAHSKDSIEIFVDATYLGNVDIKNFTFELRVQGLVLQFVGKLIYNQWLLYLLLDIVYCAKENSKEGSIIKGNNRIVGYCTTL